MHRFNCMRSKIVMAGVLAFLLTGCAGMSMSVAPLPQDKSAYVSLPYKKLINQAFLNETADKLVKFDAVFYSLMDGLVSVPDKYSSGSYVNIKIDTLEEGVDALYDKVLIPKSESDLIFELKKNDPITIYARVVEWNYFHDGRPIPAFIVWKVERKIKQ